MMDPTPFPRLDLSCHHCKASLPVGARFCVACGMAVAVPSGAPYPVQVVCPTCTTRYPDTYRYCPRDGAQLRLTPGA